MSTPLWSPTPQQIADANLTRFTRLVRTQYGVAADSYAALHRWSIERADQFWQALWQFCGVVASQESAVVVTDFDDILAARWFPDARMNFAENLLQRRDDAQAIVFWNEQGFQRALTHAELYAQVSQVAAALKTLGVTAGDRVAGFMPNMPETIVAMLAATSLGAIWSSCSPDFGVRGIVDRFGQIEPKVLFTCDGYHYGGKTFDSLDRVREACQEIGSIEHVIVVPYLNESPTLSGLPGATTWTHVLAEHQPGTIDFAQLPFDHPVYILYSSGTTGVPKCIVHRAGGVLMKHLAEHVLHCDLRPTDRLFYFTTCGWMMWNWLASGLATGCTLVLYDGSPLSPRPDILWELAEREQVTVFGTSPKCLSLTEKEGLRPCDTRDLGSLRVLLSTGSPLTGEGFDYVYSSIKHDVRLSSMSGGTDLCGSFVVGNPCLPVFRGEMQSLALGMDTRVFDEEGNSLRGEKGELVCARPFPSMPLGFWRDPDGTAYRRAYFERFPNVWHHGDYAELTEYEGMIIYGRSDAVLNPGGIRIGTAEIYRQVEQLPEVLDSVVIAQQWQGDVRVVLFVKLRDTVSLDEALIKRIRDQIRRNTTPRHVPAVVLAVNDVPRTKSGKVVELAVRDVVHGRPVKNADALANPEALEQYRNRQELQL